MRGTKDKYVFERICFGDVAFDLSENVTNRGEDFSQEYSRLYEEGLALAESRGDTDFAEEYADSATAGTVYTLRIYLPGVGLSALQHRGFTATISILPKRTMKRRTTNT